jgi:hypothetical protein
MWNAFEMNHHKEKLNEIIKEIKNLKQYGIADYEYFELDKIVEKLERFRDDMDSGSVNEEVMEWKEWAAEIANETKK